MKKNSVFIFFCLILIFQSIGQSSSVSSKVFPNAIKLSISTRHESILYSKMATAFASSPLGASVGITSASEIQFTSPSTYDGFYKEQTEPFFAKSIAWGGGPTLYNRLAAGGALSPITDTDLLNLIDSNISDIIAGSEMKKYNADNELVWVGSMISSFGFTVNHQVLADRGLTKPTTWENLSSLEFYTNGLEFNIGIGNAPDTTSITRIYQIILQKFGWEKGWEVIYRMAGNSKIYGGAIETRSSVISGETAVALTSDFNGIIAMSENPNTEYIIPENGSIVDPDPIALSKNPAHPAAAKAFIQYVLSPEGQSVLLDIQINRLPIRADAFDEPAGLIRPYLKVLYDRTINNQGILFDQNLFSSLYSAMRSHFEFTIQDVYPQLRDTWGKMVSAYKTGGFTIDPLERFNQIAIVYGMPAITQRDAVLFETSIADAAFKLCKQTEWNQFSRDKLTAVVNMIDGANYTIPSLDNTTLCSTTTSSSSVPTPTQSSSVTSENPTTTTTVSTVDSDKTISTTSSDSNPTNVSLNISMQLILAGIYASVVIKKKTRR